MQQETTLPSPEHQPSHQLQKSAAEVSSVEASVSPIQLVDVSALAGMEFQHTDGGSGEKYLVETVSAGIALFDYDNDGFTDVYLLNGTALPPKQADASCTNVLYHNEANLRFRDVTLAAGVGDSGYGLGVTAGDYDGDGFLDLYISNFGANVLYRNNGDGTFAETTQAAGVQGDDSVGAGTAFFDADNDGDLDLYVANYIEFDFKQHRRRSIDGHPCYPGPLDSTPARDLLFRNDGDGTFTDISMESGVGQVARTGMGMVCVDYDQDRDTDIFVVNDEMANLLFQNDGTGHFQEIALCTGLALDLRGQPQGNMGVDCGDYDNDGWLDFFSTSFSRELPTLLQNHGGKFFEDRTLAGLAFTSARPHVNWGTAFADFDNDRWLDLFIACGHIDQQVHEWNSNTAFRVSNLLLRNLGNGQFQDDSAGAGDGLQLSRSSRGMGVDDLDNDGDVDIVILNSRDKATVLRNDSPNNNCWLQLELRSASANRFGVGAHVRVVANGMTQLAEVHSGRGYQSHHGSRLQYGLGNCRQVERIEVQWLSGDTDVLTDVSTNQRIAIVEDCELNTDSLPNQ